MSINSFSPISATLFEKRAHSVELKPSKEVINIFKRSHSEPFAVNKRIKDLILEDRKILVEEDKRAFQIFIRKK